MPTGYTTKVASGETTDFSDFALTCARAFGVLIHMRDDPMDAPIPDNIEPSPYHKEQLEALQEERKKLLALSEDEIKAEIIKEHDDAVKFRNEMIENADNTRKRYMDMLAKTESWVPPTSGHETMKDFMIDQLRASIDWDCSVDYTVAIPPKDKNPETWLNEKLAELEKNIKYHTENYEQELDNTSAKNKWLKQLKDSFLGIYPEIVE